MLSLQYSVSRIIPSDEGPWSKTSCGRMQVPLPFTARGLNQERFQNNRGTLTLTTTLFLLASFPLVSAMATLASSSGSVIQVRSNFRAIPGGAPPSTSTAAKQHSRRPAHTTEGEENEWVSVGEVCGVALRVPDYVGRH